MDKKTAPKITVGELAKLANCSVRTLHHYDEIKLLEPSNRTDAGYRLYTAADVERLHQILVRRSLGMDLETIARILDDPAFDVGEALEEQLQNLNGEIGRLEQVRQSVAAMLENHKRGHTMTNQQIKDMFDGFDPADHEQEVKDRWGNTEQYAQSMRRTRKYRPKDWARMRAEQEQIEQQFADAMAAGLGSDETAAMDLAELHREHIDKWFYSCSHEMHAGLADMYVADPRFADHYDKRADGLASYVSAAIKSNTARR